LLQPQESELPLKIALWLSINFVGQGEAPTVESDAEPENVAPSDLFFSSPGLPIASIKSSAPLFESGWCEGKLTGRSPFPDLATTEHVGPNLSRYALTKLSSKAVQSIRGSFV